MSIPIDTLSLLGALAPLRYNSSGSSVVQENAFAEKFEQALAGKESRDVNDSSTARDLAESLTLQMLQSSLALAGDSASDSRRQELPFSSVQAFVQAYRANVAVDDSPTPVIQAPAQSQLQEFTAGEPVATTAVSSVRTRTDTAWLDPIISQASRTYGVDAGLIKAVIKAESDFNPQAVSHAGARGLMQLMPATARSLGVNDSFDPEQNVMAGTRFLKDMLHRYGGNVDSALAAYNWGPGNVDRRPANLPHETRTYLARVKQLYASYSS